MPRGRGPILSHRCHLQARASGASPEGLPTTPSGRSSAPWPEWCVQWLAAAGDLLISAQLCVQRRHVEAWNPMRWEYLCHRNWPVLQSGPVARVDVRASQSRCVEVRNFPDSCVWADGGPGWSPGASASRAFLPSLPLHVWLHSPPAAGARPLLSAEVGRIYPL